MRSAILLLAFVLGGCAASVRDATRVAHLAEGVDAHGLNREGIALLPAPIDAYPDDLRRALVYELALQIGEGRPDLRFLSLEETAGRIEAQALDRTILRATDLFRRTGNAPADDLAAIAAGLEVRYLLLALRDQILHYASTPSARGKSPSEPARYEALTVIWDAETREVVWEATGTAVASGGSGTETLPDARRLVAVAAEGLARRLPM